MSIPDLRPFTLGELLDRAFTYYRRYFSIFLGIMAISDVPSVALGVAFQIFRQRLAQASRSNPANLSTSLTISLVAILVVLIEICIYALALGATANAVSDIHVGQPKSAREAWRRMRGHIWPIIDLVGTVAMRIFIVFILVFILFFVVVGLVTALVGPPFAGPILGVLGGVLILLATAGSVVWFSLRYACAVPAIMIENLKAGGAMKRSVALTKNNMKRVFLILLLVLFVGYAVQILFQGPFYLAQYVAGKPAFRLSLGMAIGATIAGGVAHALTGGLLMIALVLLYYDIRVRNEGLDLQLMLSAVSGQASEMVASPVLVEKHEPPFEKTSVLLVVLLSLATFSLYIPIWYLRRKDAINSLRSQSKLGSASLYIIWGVLLFSVMLGILAGVWQGMRVQVDTQTPQAISQALSLAAAVLLIIKAFQVRRILEDHLAGSRRGPFASSMALLHDASLSGVATFFFGIWYLQYKINQMVDEWVRPGPELGVQPAAAATGGTPPS